MLCTYIDIFFRNNFEMMDAGSAGGQEAGDQRKPMYSAQHDYYDMMGPFSLTYNIYRPPSTHEGVWGFPSFGFENNGSVE